MNETSQSAVSGTTGPAPSRRDTILRAAYEVFAQYGFRRTSMDDIAKAAGVSRPTLYMSFANKREIFRGIVEAHIMHVSRELDALLAREDLSTDELLHEMFATALIEPHRLLEDMPHGEELLGIKTEIASDLFIHWETCTRAAYHRALARIHDPGRAELLAKVISLAISGMKVRDLTANEMTEEMKAVIMVMKG
ncbi:MAG: TetR/AcrR family transcriptional regulator [Rhizobiaceae bacterium]